MIREWGQRDAAIRPTPSWRGREEWEGKRSLEMGEESAHEGEDQRLWGGEEKRWPRPICPLAVREEATSVRHRGAHLYGRRKRQRGK